MKWGIIFLFFLYLTARGIYPESDLYHAPSGLVNLQGHHSDPSLDDCLSPILMQYGPPRDRPNLDQSEALQNSQNLTARGITCVPKRDRQRLEYFFRRLVFWDDFGYVLMGAKPSSVAVFQRPLLMPSNFRFWLGWKTWKKYEKQFSHPNFHFFCINKQDGSVLLFLVNNRLLKKTITDQRGDFEGVYAKQDPKRLFKKIIAGNRDELLGILLGYGRKNSCLYSQKNREATLVSFIDPEEHKRFSDYISAKGMFAFATGSLFEDLSQMTLPGFAVDPNLPETIHLKEKYSKNRQMIIDYYDGKDFLEASLLLLRQ